MTAVPPLAGGVWGVVATPFRGPSLAVDERSLARMVHHYGAIGAVGVVVLGVFGEVARLAPAERDTVIEVARRAAGGLPLVVGIDGTDRAGVVAQARRAVDLAGDRLAGVMVHVNSHDRDQVAEHLAAVRRDTGAGIVLQHYPEAGGAAVDSSTLAYLAATAPGVVAVKCEGNPTVEEIHAVAATARVPAFGGLGATGLLDELAAGAAGAMTGFSCPEGLVACVDAHAKHGAAAAREVFLPYLPLVNFEFQRGIGLAIRKESLRLQGLVDDPAVRPPARAMPGWLVPLLREHLTHALGKPIRSLAVQPTAGTEPARPERKTS